MMLAYFSVQILILWKYSTRMSTIRFFPVLCPDKIIKINLLFIKDTWSKFKFSVWNNLLTPMIVRALAPRQILYKGTCAATCKINSTSASECQGLMKKAKYPQNHWLRGLHISALGGDGVWEGRGVCLWDATTPSSQSPVLKMRAADLADGGKLTCCLEVCVSHTESFTQRFHFGWLRHSLPS